MSTQERRAIYEDMNSTIARIHQLEPASLGLDGFGRQGDYLQRQVSRWTRQYRASETTPIAAMDRLIDWLPAHLPAEGVSRLVHGDYRLDNVIIHPTEPRIAAVLDWELSTLGDPRADIAYHMLSWHLAPDLFRGMEGADLPALGIPDEAAYLKAYVEQSGIDPRGDWTFFLVLSMFRIAAILQGIARRAEDGSAVDAKAREIGAKAAPIAKLAVSLIDGARR
jgi:aminoglycoside phosphotransferase (APT) family kinase protein